MPPNSAYLVEMTVKHLKGKPKPWKLAEFQLVMCFEIATTMQRENILSDLAYKQYCNGLLHLINNGILHQPSKWVFLSDNQDETNNGVSAGRIITAAGTSGERRRQITGGDTR